MQHVHHYSTMPSSVTVVPATHPNALARRGKSSPFAAQGGALEGVVQQVYAPGFKTVLDIPATSIRHLPPAHLNVTRLVLCANYNPSRPHNSCPVGDKCKFVHADVGARGRKQLPQHEIHVNYAWRSVEEVTYERFPSGGVVTVCAPNVRDRTDTMGTGLMLKTRVLDQPRPVLTHCAHYYFNRTCNQGADCQFVHAVYVDPNARAHQRAPPPFLLARADQPHARQQERNVCADSFVTEDHVALCATPSFVSDEAAGDLLESPSAGATTPSVASDFADSLELRATPVRYLGMRHNPYSPTHVRQQCWAVVVA